MRRIVSILLVLLLACSILSCTIAEEKNQFTEECLFQFGNDTCDAAALLQNGSIAVVSGALYYEYEISSGENLCKQITHPELKNAAIYGISILESDQCVIIPCFDYASGQSYCAYISKTGDVFFSDLFDEEVHCGCLVGDKVLIAGIDFQNKITSSWFKVLSMDGSVECTKVLSSLKPEKYIGSASIVQCVEKDGNAVLIEQTRRDTQESIRMIEVSPDGSIANTSLTDLSQFPADQKGLQIVGTLLENDLINIYGVFPEHDGAQSTFMMRVDGQYKTCDTIILDHSKYFRIAHVINTPNGLAAIVRRSDRETDSILIGERLENDFSINNDTSERRVPDRLMFDGQNLLIVGSILQMPDSPNKTYIGLLK